jgi:hypothetical protein
MRPFRIYPASFDGNTLGYWRFGGRGGQAERRDHGPCDHGWEGGCGRGSDGCEDQHAVEPFGSGCVGSDRTDADEFWDARDQRQGRFAGSLSFVDT